MVKAFLFDIGNVLVHFCHKRMWQQLGEAYGTEDTVIKKFAFEKGLVSKYDRGLINTEEVYAHFLQVGKRAPTRQEFLHALTDIFQPNESIFDLVYSLKGKGVRLILLSNTCEAHFEHLYRQLPILQLFDHPILSYQIQACKPEKAIFSAAHAVAGCAVHECVYLDDIPEYVSAGRSFGFQAFVYQDTASLLENLQKAKIIN